jgi:hypothetical protein
MILVFAKELILEALEREFLVDLSCVHLKSFLKGPTLFLSLELNVAPPASSLHPIDECA